MTELEALSNAYEELAIDYQREKSIRKSLEDQAFRQEKAQGIRVKKAVEKQLFSNTHFTMVFHKSNLEVDDRLTEDAQILLFAMVKRMDININIVLNHDRKRMSFSDLKVMIGWSKRKTTAALNNLIDNEIIFKCKSGVEVFYIISYKYALCGDVQKVFDVITENGYRVTLDKG